MEMIGSMETIGPQGLPPPAMFPPHPQHFPSQAPKSFAPVKLLNQAFQSFAPLMQYGQQKASADGDLGRQPLSSRPQQKKAESGDSGLEYRFLDLQAKQILRDSWLKQAQGEVVSAIGFEHMRQGLMRFGAPEALLAEAKIAVVDEQRHATTCARLAQRFDPLLQQHATPKVKRSLPPLETIESLVTHIALEGCWGETLGALTAARQCEIAADPILKAQIKTIAEEELQHCALSWKAAAWAISVYGPPVAEHFSKTIVQVKRATDAKPAAPPVVNAAGAHLPKLEAFGILSLHEMDDIDRSHGPALVHELLSILQNMQAADQVSVMDLDFAAIIRLHCDRVAGNK